MRSHNLRWPHHNQAEAIEIDNSIEFVGRNKSHTRSHLIKKMVTQWINSDPTNSLRDVQIVTPDPGLYGPIVQRVFHAPEQDQRLPTSPDPLLSRPLESVAIDLFAQSYATGFKAAVCMPSSPTIRARRPQTIRPPSSSDREMAGAIRCATGA